MTIVHEVEDSPRESLTKRQQKVLDFIQLCIRERGLPPTLREIGQHMGIRSTNGVNDHLKALQRKGYLRREDLKSRALMPVDPQRTARVALVGEVAAGPLQLAVEQAHDVLEIDQALVGRSEELFALEVKGTSMIEDGILEGDYVFVKRQDTARAGETVVALVEDEATVKRYYPEGDRVRLQPANSSMSPIYVQRGDMQQAAILGVVVGVYRRL